MKKETKTVYFCDHCKKHNLSAAVISRHEKYCRHKPENKHKCFDMCSFLKREREIINGKYPGRNGSYQTVFVCLKTGKRMYSYLAEKKATSYFGCPLKMDGLERMPLYCSDHKYMSDSELERRFGINMDEI